VSGKKEEYHTAVPVLRDKEVSVAKEDFLGEVPVLRDKMEVPGIEIVSGKKE
jgi:hypothetical protein